MPGLIDCHVHVVAGIASLGGSAAFAQLAGGGARRQFMRGMLMRGFTTVRDVGGADHGLVIAVEEGSIIGPAPRHLGQGPVADRRPRRLPRPLRRSNADALPSHASAQSGASSTACRRFGVPPARRSRPVHSSSRSWPTAASPRPPIRSLPRLLSRGVGGRGRGGAHGSDLCCWASLHRRGHTPLHRCRRPLGRARQPHPAGHCTPHG